jgi:hypothetical protein
MVQYGHKELEQSIDLQVKNAKLNL